MKKILVFGASNSKESINRSLALHTTSYLNDFEILSLDLNEYEMPLFSIDRENQSGIPDAAKRFKEHIKMVDGIIISFAEHNGTYSAAFKNLFDWASRVENDMWLGRPMFLLATSPGKMGGRFVLEAAKTRFPRMGGNVVASFSLPSFGQNFSKDEGILDEPLKATFLEQLSLFERTL